jgi:hypothetical protein
MNTLGKARPYLGIIALVVAATCAAMACGQPPARNLAGSAGNISPGASATPSSPVPTQSACQVITQSGGARLFDQFGTHVGGCYGGYVAGTAIIQFTGTDARAKTPGFAYCTPPAGTSITEYCGFGPPSHWTIYPFPAIDDQDVGEGVYPGMYQCVGDASQLWTFHLDTRSYTPGCTPAPKGGIVDPNCDAFLYLTTFTTPELYRRYGKAVACQTFDRTVVGIVSETSTGGAAVCGPVPAPTARLSTADQIAKMCGFSSPKVSLNVWQFVALPASSGAVTAASFDANSRTACVTAGTQSFTFTLATRAFTHGCPQ